MGKKTPPPPPWFSVLRYQREALGLTGLTIPFLVGMTFESLQPEQLEEQALYTELTSLLFSFRDATPASHCVVIAECDTLYQPVVALYPTSARREDCEGVAASTEAETRLYVQRGYFQRRDWSIDSAIEWLWDRFGRPLIRGEFSFQKTEEPMRGEYVGFNAQDREFLKRAREWRPTSNSSVTW